MMNTGKDLAEVVKFLRLQEDTHASLSRFNS